MKVILLYWYNYVFQLQQISTITRSKLGFFTQNSVQNLMKLVLMPKSKRKKPKNA